jgi:hypothetical protein
MLVTSFTPVAQLVDHQVELLPVVDHEELRVWGVFLDGPHDLWPVSTPPG